MKKLAGKFDHPNPDPNLYSRGPDSLLSTEERFRLSRRYEMEAMAIREKALKQLR
jgi:hypothetical protein